MAISWRLCTLLAVVSNLVTRSDVTFGDAQFVDRIKI